MDVMIVDDCTKIRAMLSALLKNQLTDLKNIYECKSGTEAITCYEKNKPDWTLMDIRMEPLNGFSVSQKILDMNPRAKIMIVTSYDDPEYREKAKQLKVAAYVLKDNLNDVIAILKGLF
ncbi:MAG TPA: response regulator transcription factor [Caldithrix abyssi]|uniref:Response regulator transcription factor n=1 Tax=Caldithrix abyssi TaxID=187145 RepID=A0A7V4U373_CALAY|nr:response regulator transcription factor [Caldithrix abyssi]